MIWFPAFGFLAWAFIRGISVRIDELSFWDERVERERAKAEVFDWTVVNLAKRSETLLSQYSDY